MPKKINESELNRLLDLATAVPFMSENGKSYASLFYDDVQEKHVCIQERGKKKFVACWINEKSVKPVGGFEPQPMPHMAERDLWEFAKGNSLDLRYSGRDLYRKLHESGTEEEPEVEVTEGEMVPVGKPNPARVADLLSIDEQIDAEYESFKDAENAGTVHAVRLGILLEYKKETLPHGKFESWQKDNCRFSLTHSRRFRDIAKKFLKEQQLKASQLFLGAPMVNTIGGADVVSSRMNDEADQMLFDFVGGRTLPELCEDLNVRWREAKKKQLSANDEKEPPQTLAQKKETALQLVMELQADVQKRLLEDHGRKQLLLLDKANLQALEADLVSATLTVRELLN